ncbi:glycosyltransferase [Panacibacter ginsenosidivorans]|uniref:Glycosyltransferase n=1 Tax=Panacibacter ginsenosidivorans TaxID=1813871 RepID=A0A5B8V4Q9_9BACT|nr:glycosyltransferase [Panacibacter ginsenosidivorans]QEC66168.1 glycosyltransferase [Panacibacter ginsenosidivorans]
MIEISVVIPTCNRKERLISLLHNLERSTFPLKEVIIVDSGEDRLSEMECSSFQNLDITYVSSKKSVCKQRNKGIAIAKSEWIFVCDDDIEVPANYIEKLVSHIDSPQKSVCVSGLFLQKDKGEWIAKYNITSGKTLLWNYIFNLSLWGEINCKDNILTKGVKQYYKQKHNHISKAGWPVITDFSGEYFVTPLYSLGASLVKKTWLINSAFDEVLDRHGIGDHYGVIAGFPLHEVHVLNTAFVYHHHEEANRLQNTVQYYRRVLALDYFRRIKKQPGHVKKIWLLWSLCGNLLAFISRLNGNMIIASLKLLFVIGFNKNPYFIAAKNHRKVQEPVV